MKSIVAWTVLALFLVAPQAPAATQPLQPPPDIGPGKAVAALADRDGDRLSDGLQRRLAVLSPSEPVEVVVTFNAPGNASAAQHAVGPFQVRREFRIVNGFAAVMTAGQAKALSRAPGVFRVEEDFKVTAQLDAANADFGTLAARSAFAATGAGVGICVVDTGVNPAHEQLDGGKVVAFADFINGQTAAYDDHGHGTHVSAIAAGDGTGGASAGKYRGVAPGATIFAAKVLDAQGSGSESAVISGIEWCADPARGSLGPGVQVISMSLGADGSSDGRDALSQAVNAAVSAGKVTVVAAGNAGDGPESVGSPGAAAQALTVGAAAEWSAPPTAPNHSKGIYPAPFSSRGPTADGRAKPDILAPGVTVTSAQSGTASGYVTWSGTSMATPFVSGTVALALSLDRTLTPAQVKSLLTSTAQDRGPAGLDNDWGAGLLDGYRFVADAAGSPPDPAAFAFPTAARETGTVPRGGVKEFFFEIGPEDLNIPIAAALTITSGGQICTYGTPFICDLLGGWAWTPDFDAELIRVATNTIVDSSICPLSGECGTLGRQETLRYLPTTASDIGTYKIRVYQFPDDPGGLQDGSVALDLSTGPLANAGGGTINQPPVANAGTDQSVADSDGNGTQSVTLNGSGSSDPDGTITSYVWAEGTTQVATGVAPTVTLPVGIHTLTLTVTDHDGASATDVVVVTISANQPPAANAGPDQTVTDSDGNGIQSITLNGSGSSDPDGTITSYVWREGATQVATGATPTVSLSVGVHTITLTVTDNGGGAASDTVIVTVQPANPPPEAPGAFTLLTPTNGAINVARTATAFDWSDSAGATAYTIVVDNNRDFSSPLFSETGLPASSYTSKVGLGSRTTYYWKVIAVNANGSAQSGVFKFKTRK